MVIPYDTPSVDTPEYIPSHIRIAARVVFTLDLSIDEQVWYCTICSNTVHTKHLLGVTFLLVFSRLDSMIYGMILRSIAILAFGFCF